MLDKGLAATLAPLQEAALKPCQSGAFFLNPLHPSAGELDQAIERMQRLIPLAAEAGCPWIAFAGGSYNPDIFGGSDPRNLQPRALDDAARVLEPLARLAEKHQVRLSLEPHIRSVLATPERAAELCSKVGSPALRVTWDPSNFYDFFDLIDADPMLERCARALAPWCGLVHFKEVALSGGFHLHAGLVPMGQGRTDWAKALSVVSPIAPRDGWLVVEHCGSEAEAMASIALVRTAAQGQGIAVE